MTSGHFLFPPQLFGRLGLYSSKYEIETNFPPCAGRGRRAPIRARRLRATARQTKSTISNGPSPAVGESHRRGAREVESGASKGHGRSRRPRCAGETETGAQGIPRSDAARTLESGPNDPAHPGKNARRSTRPGLTAPLRNYARRAFRRKTVRVPRSPRRSPCCTPSRTSRADRTLRRQS